MKKLIIACLCLLLVTAIATTAFAGSGFSMSASSKTLRRGDTVTLTVSVSSSEPATSFGLKLGYDTSVFEYVSSSCTVGGALVASANSSGFAFMFQNPTAYSGAVGTMTLRVKDTAPFGTYTVSGSASVMNGSDAVGASGCSASLSVVCDHSYGAWEKADDTSHKQSCSICNDTKTEAHKWDAGKVTKEATCKEEGVKTFTCSTCKAAKEEKIDKKAHTFGNLVYVDENNHKDVCKVCNDNVTEAHTWNKGTVTKQPTCKEEGEKTFTCTGCKGTKVEKIEKTTTHSFSKWTKVDAETHKRTCKVCDLEETGTHSYKTTWSKDAKEHFHACSACNDRKDAEAHKPGPAATEQRAQTCTTCGYVIRAALAHVHKYATEWTTDEEGHWYTCSGCEEKGEYKAHDFEKACDPDCSVCGYTRETAHSFEEKWTTDGQNHWHVCSGCGLKEDEEAHTPGAEATEEAAQTCTICGYELAPKLEPAVTEPVQEETPDAEENEQQSFPWWIVIVAAAAVAVGAVAVVVKKKK